MNQRNLYNIRERFREKTGVDLPSGHRYLPMRRAAILIAALLACIAMAAFTWPLFSSLDGDELALWGTYEADGIVSVRVENRSDKRLEFQPQTKLVRWVDGREVESLGGPVVFENRVFEPHSTGVMTIDLSRAYDIRALEQSATNAEWFYLLLTNNNFLFGQDWMCSISFAEPVEEERQESQPESVPAEAAILEDIPEELRFYFESSYTDQLLAFNEANFRYQEKVAEYLARFPGTLVPALSPSVLVGGPSEFLDPEPMMGKPPETVVFDPDIPREEQYLLTWAEWSYTDAYGRMVATREEKAWTQVAVLPQRQGDTDGGVTVPLVFLFVYDAQLAREDNYAFVYGRVRSFGELEAHLVIRDEHYAVYDLTDLIYTDPDAYLDGFLAGRTDVYCDGRIRERVHGIYDFYQDPENIRAMYGYLEVP